MNLSDFEALSFDCYGTLIDWEAGIGTVLSAWALQHGLPHDREALLTTYADHEARTERESPSALYSEVLARSFVAVGDELGVPVTDAWAKRLGQSVPSWPAFPDSHTALSSLGQHYQLIILSNVHRAGFEGSRRRLDVQFDDVLTAEDIGSYKPSPHNFDRLQQLCRDQGVRDGKLLHVAQSLFHDHVPAKRAGLPTVWINRRQDQPGWGATPDPASDVRPDWEFPNLQRFSEACQADRASTSA